MFVDVVGGDAAHLPSCVTPRRFLARVLADVLVIRAAVDLNDQLEEGPAQVRLLPSDVNV